MNEYFKAYIFHKLLVMAACVTFSSIMSLPQMTFEISSNILNM